MFWGLVRPWLSSANTVCRWPSTSMPWSRSPRLASCRRRGSPGAAGGVACLIEVVPGGEIRERVQLGGGARADPGGVRLRRGGRELDRQALVRLRVRRRRQLVVQGQGERVRLAHEEGRAGQRRPGRALAEAPEGYAGERSSRRAGPGQSVE